MPQVPVAAGRQDPFDPPMPTTLPDIDFARIVVRGGSQPAAFEELCCHLAAEHYRGGRLQRLRGAGGDGGVECRIEFADGRVVGIQAKYGKNFTHVLRQAATSFRTALKQHPDLTNYVVCIALDPTGNTARNGQSGQERIVRWIDERKEEAKTEGRSIEIEFWTASTLRGYLLDNSGAEATIRYYFDQTLLTDEWWRDHRCRVRGRAGPRYTPESSIETTPLEWFRSFGRVGAWKEDLRERIAAFFGKMANHLGDFKAAAQLPSRYSSAKRHDTWSPAWPEAALPHLRAVVKHTDEFRRSCDQLVTVSDTSDKGDYGSAVSWGSQLMESLHVLDEILSDDLDRRHYSGASASPNFRQVQAEWGASLPAANLNGVRRVLEHAVDLLDWLRSPRCSLAFEEVFFLTGRAGVGKTHTVCDVQKVRAGDDLPTVVSFGDQIDPTKPLDPQLAASLGLPENLGLSALIDLLAAEGRIRSVVTLICIDAVDEAKHREQWPNAIRELVSLVKERRWLRLCVVCRTSYAGICLPDGADIPIVQHPGFGDLARMEVARYMAHFGLRMPTTPLLPPEFTDPLYLRLACEAAHSHGLRSVPRGWFGIRAGITEFLKHKDKEFSRAFGLRTAAGVVNQGLTALATGSDATQPGMSHKDAVNALRSVLCEHGDMDPGRVLSWFVGAGLLIEEGSSGPDTLLPSTTVRLGYGRLRDFLLAWQLTADLNNPDSVLQAARPEGRLHYRWATTDTVHADLGLMEALSILIPETHPGVEVPDLVICPNARVAVLGAWISSFVSRDPRRFLEPVVELTREALADERHRFEMLDALLANCWCPSLLDVDFIDKMLRSQPLARRDAVWCRYLRESYEGRGSVLRLIEATHDATLSGLDPSEARRWATALLWFTAAADGRVRDHATRAAIRLILAHPDTIVDAVERLLDCDDDLVRERALLSAYGALMSLGDGTKTHALAEILRREFTADPASFNHAALRDLIRCIADLANYLRGDALATDSDFLDRRCSAEWVPDIPTTEECKRYRVHQYFQPVEYLSDFVKYTLRCLSPWENYLSREEMGRWIVRYVSETLGYEASDCCQYDADIVRNYGQGRGKAVWAERIGKKYQRIALQRLASSLHDYVAPSAPWWDQSASAPGLILPDERLFDPTVRRSGQAEVGIDSAPVRPLLIKMKENTTEKEWLAEEDDLPAMRQLLSVEDTTGRGWWALLVYWSGDGPALQWRRRWVHVFAHLVDVGDFEKAIEFLHNRNFYGKWMPEGRDLSGFLGEYPWGAVFADARAGRSHYAEHEESQHPTEKSPVRFEPAWNRVFSDEQYDVTMPASSGLHVPSFTWFDAGDLAWNGRDGYRRADGMTVFRTPPGEAGSAQLVADPADLSHRLADRGKRLIWTALGEKEIGIPFRTGRTFSQVAYLGDDGELRIGKRMSIDYKANKAGPEFRNRFVKRKRR